MMLRAMLRLCGALDFMLSRISIGWGWLEKTLNTLIDAINVNQPLGSASIAIEQSPNGTMLRVVDQTKDQQKQPAGGGGGGSTGAVIWQGVSWKTVTVVDPNNNCAQSQISVLVQSSGGQIKIQ